MSIVFGRRSPRFETQATRDFFTCNQKWVHLLEPGNAPPVDLIPILKWIPERFAGWKQKCSEVRRLQRKLYFGLMDDVKERLARGDTNGCFMETVLERADEWELDRELTGYVTNLELSRIVAITERPFRYVGGALLEAGSDTTSTFIQSLILALQAHPEVQKKAQAELDRVIGIDRAPVLGDVEDLPYCQAIILEV